MYTYPDGSQMIAEYKRGVLDGAFTELDSSGEITVLGCHAEDRRTGFLQVFDEDGSVLMGNVDECGQLSGEDIAYVYPDKHNALLGTFNDGILVKARYATMEKPLLPHLTKIPKFKLNPNYPTPVVFDQSSHDILSLQPLLPDAYEQERVHVCPSLIPNAGEGLFARRNLSEGEVVSFYNGVRLSHTEVDSKEWTQNSNTISLDDSTVLDVPSEYTSTSRYCATLAHKANHSSYPNSQYAEFSHPRFGEIKCISTLRVVEEGEELTCDYDYTHKCGTTGLDDLPDWFVRQKAKK